MAGRACRWLNLAILAGWVAVGALGVGAAAAGVMGARSLSPMTLSLGYGTLAQGRVSVTARLQGHRRPRSHPRAG